MPESIPVVLSPEENIGGLHPLVMIGPNGAGKTRLGAQLAKQNDAAFISALRNLELGNSIPMRASREAMRQTRRSANRSRDEPWRLASDLDNLMSQFLVEDGQSAIEYRDKSTKKWAGPPDVTKLVRLRHFWNRHFPGRSIEWSYEPRATSSLSESRNPYPVGQMSDGERVALYLAARVLNAAPGLIFIDEPEVHFHTLLASRIWDDLESMRQDDCRFVYITHDLPFALSRRSAQFIIVRSLSSWEVVEQKTDIPGEVFERLLGAASFSVSARRIVFCEGAREGSRDERLYRAWFSDPQTVVVPVGGCRDVVQCVQFFESSGVVKGGTAIGIVDRDYWPDKFLEALPAAVHELDVHEVESLLCRPEVFQAIAKHQGIEDESTISEKYKEFMASARGLFRDKSLAKQILERTRKRLETEMMDPLNRASCCQDVRTTKLALVGAVQNWGVDPGEVYDQEERVVEAAVGGSVDDFLKVLPGKPYFRRMLHALGLDEETFMRNLHAALSLPDDEESQSPHYMLKQGLVAALEAHLPRRRFM